VLSAQDLAGAQRLVRQIPVSDQVVEAILRLVRSARPGTPDAGKRVNEYVAWGPGPRASQALMMAVRARALLDGRLAPSIDDVVELAEPILKHRMALSFAARADDVPITDIVATLTKQLG
jgi:MoxR-like ATPase